MTSTEGDLSVFFWTSNNTKILIDYYKEYKSKIGTMAIKNYKVMWEKIAHEMSNKLGNKILAKNCENRWKVLERNYKKYVENKNSTGRGRKIFEFSQEMDDIYEKKKNIHPILVLSTEMEHEPEKENVDNNIEVIQVSSPMPSSQTPSLSKGENLRKTRTKTRKTILERIREDRLNYQRKRLELLEKANNQFLEIQAERNEILKKNNLIEEEKLKQRLI